MYFLLTCATRMLTSKFHVTCTYLWKKLSLGNIKLKTNIPWLVTIIVKLFNFTTEIHKNTEIFCLCYVNQTDDEKWINKNVFLDPTLPSTENWKFLLLFRLLLVIKIKIVNITKKKEKKEKLSSMKQTFLQFGNYNSQYHNFPSLHLFV